MRTLSLAILLAAKSLCAATLDNNTVTVTATRTINLQPDQVLFYVSVLTLQDAGLDDVLAKLKGTGITGEHLNGVSPAYVSAIPSGAVNPATALWTFILPVSFANMKQTMLALAQAQSGLGSLQGAQVLTYSAFETRYSQEAQAAQPCPLSALVSDARKQADVMAAAAGMKTGAIVSVSDGSSLDGTGPIGAPAASMRAGDFSYLLLGAPIYGRAVPTTVTVTPIVSAVMLSLPQPACSLTVQFKLMP